MKVSYLIEQLNAAAGDDAEELVSCLEAEPLSGDDEITTSDWLRLLRQNGLFLHWSRWIQSEAGHEVSNTIVREYRELEVSGSGVLVQDLWGGINPEDSWFDKLLMEALTSVDTWVCIEGQSFSSFDVLDLCCGRSHLPEEEKQQLVKVIRDVPSDQGTAHAKFFQLLLLVYQHLDDLSRLSESVHWSGTETLPRPEDLFLFDGHLIAIALFYYKGHRLPECLLTGKAKALQERLPKLSRHLFKRGCLDDSGCWRDVTELAGVQGGVGEVAVAHQETSCALLDVCAEFYKPPGKSELPEPCPDFVVDLNRAPTAEMVRDNPNVLFICDAGDAANLGEEATAYRATFVIAVNKQQMPRAATSASLTAALQRQLISPEVFELCAPFCREEKSITFRFQETYADWSSYAGFKRQLRGVKADQVVFEMDSAGNAFEAPVFNSDDELIVLRGQYFTKASVCTSVIQQLNAGIPCTSWTLAGQTITDFDLWRLHMDDYVKAANTAMDYKNTLETEPDIARIPVQYFIELDGWILDFRDLFIDVDTYHLNAKNGDQPFSQAARQKILAHPELRNRLGRRERYVVELDGLLFDVRRIVSGAEADMHLNPKDIGMTFSPEALRTLFKHPEVEGKVRMRRFIVELNQVPTAAMVFGNPDAFLVYDRSALDYEGSDDEDKPVEVKAVHYLDGDRGEVRIDDIAHAVSVGDLSMSLAWATPLVQHAPMETGEEANSIMTSRPMDEIKTKDIVVVPRAFCFVDKVLFEQFPLSSYALYAFRCASASQRAAIKSFFSLDIDLNFLEGTTVQFVGPIPKDRVFFQGKYFVDRHQLAPDLQLECHMELGRATLERWANEAPKKGPCWVLDEADGSRASLELDHEGEVIWLHGFPCDVDSLKWSLAIQASSLEGSYRDILRSPSRADRQRLMLLGQPVSDYDVWRLLTDRRIGCVGSVGYNATDPNTWTIPHKYFLWIDGCAIDAREFNSQAALVNPVNGEVFTAQGLKCLSTDENTRHFLTSRCFVVCMEESPDKHMVTCCPEICFVRGGPFAVFRFVKEPTHSLLFEAKLAQRVSEGIMPIALAFSIIKSLLPEMKEPLLDGKADSLEFLITGRSLDEITAEEVIVIEDRFIDRKLFEEQPLSSYALYVLKVCSPGMRALLIEKFDLEHPGRALAKRINFDKIIKQDILLVGECFYSQQVLTGRLGLDFISDLSESSHEDFARAAREVQDDYPVNIFGHDEEATLSARDVPINDRVILDGRLYSAQQVIEFLTAKLSDGINIVNLCDDFTVWMLSTDIRFLALRELFPAQFLAYRNPINHGVMETQIGIPVGQIPLENFIVLDGMVFDVSDLTEAVELSEDPLMILQDPSTGKTFSDHALGVLREHPKTAELITEADLYQCQAFGADKLHGLLGPKVLKQFLVAAWALDHDHSEEHYGNNRLTTEVAFTEINYVIYERIRDQYPEMDEAGIEEQVSTLLSERVYYRNNARKVCSIQLRHMLTGQGFSCTAYAQRNLWIILHLLTPTLSVPQSVVDYWVDRSDLDDDEASDRFPDVVVGAGGYRVTNALAHIEDMMKVKYGEEWPDEWPDACPLGNVEAETYAFATTLFESGVIGDGDIDAGVVVADDVGAGAAAAMP